MRKHGEENLEIQALLTGYPNLEKGLTSIVETALRAAMCAGEIQLADFRKPGVQVTKLPHDVTIETDRRCEQEIRSILHQEFPSHAVITEEGGIYHGDGDYLWIIDPLDGTVNFLHGLPYFCVSVACYRNHLHRTGNPQEDFCSEIPAIPLAGVVFLPYLREVFIGISDKGAFLNGKPIRVSDVKETREAMIGMNFGKTPDAMQVMSRQLEKLLHMVQKVRCLGAAAAEIAYTAAGFLSGLTYEGLRLWDFAAAKIILEEAGGVFEAVKTGSCQWRVIVSAPDIRKALTQAMSDTVAETPGS